MIQPAAPTHAAALAAIHTAAFPAEGWSATVMGLQLGLPGMTGFIDPAGGMVLARVAADEAEIITLAVLPEARRRGIGGALLRAAMAEAARRGATILFLEVAEDNLAARALYAASGFAPAGRRPNYYGTGRDALLLRAGLSTYAAKA